MSTLSDERRALVREFTAMRRPADTGGDAAYIEALEQHVESMSDWMNRAYDLLGRFDSVLTGMQVKS
jgi:hypothetical protein